MTADHDLCELSAVDAVAAMSRGDVSAEAYAQALLERCAAGADLNAFITLEPERVLQAARAADRFRSSGGPVGPMHGLPIPVKDSVNTSDLPTTAGTRALRGFRPAIDAPSVAMLRAAGAIVLGKTNLHELSFGWTSNNLEFGPVRNPYDRSRIPGGSTGGTAAAVAARMAPLGVAEDTEGSIRVPAALCGICGFRPTTGRYPTAGTAPISPLFDQIGSHARTVDDLMLFDTVMTWDARPILPVSLDGLRLGVPRDYFYQGLDPEVARLIETALDRLRSAGVELVEVRATGLADLVERVTGHVQIHDAAPALTHYLRLSGAPVSFETLVGQVSQDVKGIFERFVLPGAPFAVSEDVYRAARDVYRPTMQALFAQIFARDAVAAIVVPATMIAATPIGEDDTVAIAGRKVPFQAAISRNIAPGSTAGLPGLVIPAGLTAGTHLPVGLELDGPAGADRHLLAIGRAIQETLDPIPGPGFSIS